MSRVYKVNLGNNRPTVDSHSYLVDIRKLFTITHDFHNS